MRFISLQGLEKESSMTTRSELLEQIGVKSLTDALYTAPRCFRLDDEIRGQSDEDRARQWKQEAISLERDLLARELFGKILEHICVGYYLNHTQDKENELRDDIGHAIKILSGRPV